MKMLPVSAVLLALSLTSSGCLFETTLDTKGGGVMTITYRLKEEAKLKQEKKKLQSSVVKLTSAKLIDGDSQAQFKIEFADVTKLRTARFFKDVTVTRADGGKKGTTVVTAKIAHAKPFKVPDKAVEGFGKEVKFAVTFPGEIVEANAKSTKGKTATWVYGLSEFFEAPEVLLTATYKE